MTIIHNKTREGPYVMLDKTALEDRRLSLRAKGLHAYLVSRPRDWSIYIAQLETMTTDKRDAIRSALHELVLAGYARIRRHRVEKGRFKGWEIDVYETPELATEALHSTETGLTEIGLAEIGDSGFGEQTTNTTTSTESGLRGFGEQTTNTTTSTESGFTEIGETQATKELLTLRKKIPPTASQSSPRAGKAPEYSETFLHFWDVYPHSHRQAKRKCFALWHKKQLGTRLEEIVEKIEALKLTRQWRQDFVPAPLTWLNQERYDDERAEPEPELRVAPRTARTARASQRIIEEIEGGNTGQPALLFSARHHG